MYCIAFVFSVMVFKKNRLKPVQIYICGFTFKTANMQEDGCTPLHMAARFRQIAVLSALLAHPSVDINAAAVCLSCIDIFLVALVMVYNRLDMSVLFLLLTVNALR